MDGQWIKDCVYYTTAVGIVRRLRAGQPSTHGFIPGGGKIFSLLQSLLPGDAAQPASHSKGTADSILVSQPTAA